MNDTQYKELLDSGIPYVPQVRKVRKLPKTLKFNPKDMLFKKELETSAGRVRGCAKNYK